jgi:hypothetical protein
LGRKKSKSEGRFVPGMASLVSVEEEMETSAAGEGRGTGVVLLFYLLFVRPKAGTA